MEILIKGMKMPKSCFDCPFMYHRTLCAANAKLVFDDRNYSELKGRYDGCPLIEIPDHGDLIETDAAIDELRERIRANGYTNVALVSELNRSIGYLMRLPAVIPAERSE